jgi:hypothetical protein
MINFFSKTQPKSEDKSYANSIQFLIDKTNNIKVDFVLDDPDPDAPVRVGDFLYHLSNGHYVTHILDLLINIANNKPEHKEYIYDIINAWSLNLKDGTISGDTSQEPIVKPSLFQQHIFQNKIK